MNKNVSLAIKKAVGSIGSNKVSKFKDNGPKKPPTPKPCLKPLENICCSHCFIFLENETKFIKRAQIGKHKFGFCTVDCYDLWLKSPHTMLIGKLN